MVLEGTSVAYKKNNVTPIHITESSSSSCIKEQIDRDLDSGISGLHGSESDLRGG